eukprot:3455702-Rhodomonas_salina.1
MLCCWFLRHVPGNNILRVCCFSRLRCALPFADCALWAVELQQIKSLEAGGGGDVRELASAGGD